MMPLRALKELLRRWLVGLDAEKVSTFQTMYYCLFVIAGLGLTFIPSIHVTSLNITLSRPNYDAWVVVNLLCPLLTLAGRRLTLRASHAGPGEPNPAYGAAILQLVGDFGVWSCINIYITSFVIGGGWLQEFLCFIFLVMGVLGGAMFTVRSVRRLAGIERRNRQEKTCQTQEAT